MKFFRSDLTPKEFAKKHKIHYNTFSGWIRKNFKNLHPKTKHEHKLRLLALSSPNISLDVHKHLSGDERAKMVIESYKELEKF